MWLVCESSASAVNSSQLLVAYNVLRLDNGNQSFQHLGGQFPGKLDQPLPLFGSHGDPGRHLRSQDLIFDLQAFDLSG